jgi:hypothetical protein
MCSCRALRTDPGRASSSCSVWPSRAGPRAGKSPFRSTSVRRRRRGGLPRRAARASPLHSPARGPGLGSSLRGRAAPPLGSFAPARGPRPDATRSGPVGLGYDLRSAGARRRRRGTFAPARGPRLAAPPPARGPARPLRYFHSLLTMCGACVVPLGPPRRLAATPVAGTGGGRVPPSRGSVRPARRCGVELRGDVSLPPASLHGDGGAVLQAHSYHPSWDKQESSNEAFIAGLTVCQRDVTA